MILPKEEGWINLDMIPGEGVDEVWDIQDKDGARLFLKENEYDEILMSHVFEHLPRPLAAMECLWRMAKPGALMTVRCPWGGSHIAFEDPTHVRQVFLQTMHYFSQTAYNAADYGYKGDWWCKRQIVVIDSKRVDRRWPIEMLHEALLTQWNVGVEIISELYAEKPARAAGTPSPAYQLELAFDFQLQEMAQNDAGLIKPA